MTKFVSDSKDKMIDNEIIREKYASMPDSELLGFAENEGHQLTREALDLLDAELRRRKLEGAVHGANEATANGATEKREHPDSPLLAYVFDEKENGKHDSDVITGLLELGIDEETGKLFLVEAEEIAKKRLKKAELELLTGIAILSGGIAITFLPLSMPANRLTYIIACCAMLLGGLQVLKGIYNKSRFKKIIKNLN